MDETINYKEELAKELERISKKIENERAEEIIKEAIDIQALKKNKRIYGFMIQLPSKAPVVLWIYDKDGCYLTGSWALDKLYKPISFEKGKEMVKVLRELDF